ncbi:hypothetical protein BBK36DRAFT_1108951 [Trichoderma citrinoviride]|uniref:Fe2OG dioxygenase domain-containing protein n=1 Tax=Trichoderma citrinoviride TaxID=58853 RepID=A0A2T4BMU1_9HYPO|nr:hypothetical protein BBK36DRAFT_1108951 [Trichoderma citrinoviride]PTB70622.1 hypothetical protein BBK36DRAFT_1108951 [Trichoderma citrinoviride]
MESFLTGPKRKSTHVNPTPEPAPSQEEGEESTEIKLAMLSSLHPHIEQETLLDVLLAHDGSVSQASESLKSFRPGARKSAVVGHQRSLRLYTKPAVTGSDELSSSPKKRAKSKKGSTLHLYDPEDVAEHTPCTIIHNFLPAELADELLRELLHEAESFEKITFKLFDNIVSSPHTSCLFLESQEEIQEQKHNYFYNGGMLNDVRKLTPTLAKVKPIVQETVNEQIQTRIKTHYPGGKKLRHQPSRPWTPNAAFVNCYTGAQQSVGWHSDQPTYLGPRAVIGSISLGVAREFRVRKILPRDAETKRPDDPDGEGQISIHLPHNSLLVMHAEMQEEWKHSISPALSIDPHPISGNKRINITYRDYRPEMHPSLTPRCHCNIPCVLRVVQRKKENHGKYFWMCYANAIPDKDGCSFFQWAEFDEEGVPIQKKTTTTTTTKLP